MASVACYEKVRVPGEGMPLTSVDGPLLNRAEELWCSGGLVNAERLGIKLGIAKIGHVRTSLSWPSAQLV